ncbi:MAG: amidohydrolase family protein [Bacteroidia bacterium]
MIDSHVHFWNFDSVRDNWITPDMSVIQRNFSPANFLDACLSTPISGCIAVQADQTEEQNHFLLSLAKENPVIKGIVGWVDLLTPNLDERLLYWKQFDLIKGWRHVLQSETDDFILNKDFISGLKQLKNFNYSYDLLCYHNQLKAITKMVDQVPNQKFVLDHCGKPNIKGKNIKRWSADLKILAENPNVYCKLSGLLTEAHWFNFTEKEIFKCFDVVFNEFGIKRLMYGSDWPVMLVSRPYADWFNLVKKYLSQFSVLDQQHFFELNAKRLYS